METAQTPDDIERRRQLVLLVAVCWTFFASLHIADPDLWGHTLYGMRAIEQGILTEREDPFSYTAPSAEWINHEWAAEYEMGAAWKTGSQLGLITWKMLCITGFLILAGWWSNRQESSTGANLLLFVFTTLSLGNFAVFIRPQLVTFFCFPIVLAILRADQEKATRFVWALPVVIAFWVNHHGGFLAGIAIVGLFAAWDLITRKGNERFRLSLITVLCFGATFVNPFGWHLHRMLWGHLVVHQDVREWQALWELPFSFVYAVPFLLAGLAFTMSRRWKWIDLIVMLAIAGQAAIHLRHVALFNLACLIVLPVPMTDALRRMFPQICQQLETPRSFGLRWGGVLAVSAFVVLLQLRGAVPLLKDGVMPWEIAVNRKSDSPGMPVDAVIFIKASNIQGNLVTSYGWGQFAIWQLYPDCKVGFDGRYRTIYPPDVERDFIAFQNGPDTETGDGSVSKQAAMLDDYPTEIALLPVGGPAEKYLRTRDDWWHLYDDGQAVIFLPKSHPLSQRRLTYRSKPDDLNGLRPVWENFPGNGVVGTNVAFDK